MTSNRYFTKGTNLFKEFNFKGSFKGIFNYILLIAALHSVALLQCLIGSSLTYFLNITWAKDSEKDYVSILKYSKFF